MYLGIDQGSRSTKGILIDENLKIISQYYIPTSVNIDGKSVRQDPEEIYQSILEISSWAKKQAPLLKSVGIAFQRSGVCAFNKNGEAVSELYTWEDTSCDSEIPKDHAQKKLINEKTTLPVKANYAAAKIAYLQRIHNKDIFIGTLDTYIRYRLSDSKIFLTEHSMASRSMLYDISLGKWDEEICNILKVDVKRLPKISNSIFKESINGIPLVSSLGDQQSALFLAKASGYSSVLTLGTIGSLSTALNTPSLKNGYLTNVLINEEGESQFFLEAVTNACGNLISEIVETKNLNMTEISKIVSDIESKDFVSFYPHGGTGSPDWGKSGLPSFNREPVDYKDRLKGYLDNIAHFITLNVKNLINDKFINNNAPILVGGGIGKCDYLVQYITDLTGVDLHTISTTDTTGLGSAVLAFKAFNNKKEIKFNLDIEKKFVPQVTDLNNFTIWKSLYDQWIKE